MVVGVLVQLAYACELVNRAVISTSELYFAQLATRKVVFVAVYVVGVN